MLQQIAESFWIQEASQNMMEKCFVVPATEKISGQKGMDSVVVPVA